VALLLVAVAIWRKYRENNDPVCSGCAPELIKCYLLGNQAALAIITARSSLVPEDIIQIPDERDFLTLLTALICYCRMVVLFYYKTLFMDNH